jgi:hypothetical protein
VNSGFGVVAEACTTCCVGWHGVGVDIFTAVAVQLGPFNCFVYQAQTGKSAIFKYLGNGDGLSSKSANRFLVNFQMKNATTPMTATPPATDIPMMEPVPRPELVAVVDDEGAAVVVEEPEEEEEEESVCVNVCVPTVGGVEEPPVGVVTCCCSVVVGAVEVVAGALVVCWVVVGGALDCWDMTIRGVEVV